jgi:hypothetical protein
MDPKSKIGAWEGEQLTSCFQFGEAIGQTKKHSKGYVTHGHSRANTNCHTHGQELEKCLLHMKQLLQNELECIWMQ